MTRFAIVLATALAAAAMPATAAEKGGALAPPVAGAVVIGDVSVPVVAGGKVRAYQYGTVGIDVADTVKDTKTVCDKRYELADAFLLRLHGSPFSAGLQVEGPKAEAAILAIARKIVGEGIVTGVRVAWSPNPRPFDNTAFGRATDVACKAK